MKNVSIFSRRLSLLPFFLLWLGTSQAEICAEESAIQVIKACHILGPPLVSTPNTCPASSIPVKLSESGDLFITAQVFTTHLANVTPSGYYTLPAGTPPMYLQLSNKDEGISVLVGPFVNFVYDPSIQSTNDPLFHADIDVILALNDFPCKGENSTPGPIKTADLKLELLTPMLDGSAGFEMYPIHDYSNPGDIFTCTSFSETCYDCGNPNCAALLDPIYQELLCFDCLEDQDKESMFRNENTTLQEAITWKSQMNPNPFEQQVELNIEGLVNGSVGLEIYSSKGQLLRQDLLTWEKDATVKYINTADLAPGLYYFQINNGTHSAIHKLLKSEF